MKPSKRRILPKGAFALLVTQLLVPLIAFAEDFAFGGHIKSTLLHSQFSPDDLRSVLGNDTLTDANFDGRLNFSTQSDAFTFIAQGELLGRGGDSKSAQLPLLAVSPAPLLIRGLPDDDRRVFDLTAELAEEDDYDLVTRLDRLAITYKSENFVTRVGREAISWGNGLAFQTLDIFNPFSPIEIDKDYKTGDDLIFSQYQFSSGADVQGLLVPRRHPQTHSLQSNQSSYALRYHTKVLQADLDLVASAHYDEPLLGLGFSYTIFDGVFRLDTTATDLADDSWSMSLVANYDRSFTVAQKNLYAFLEYFHSGVGTSESNYLTPSPALLARLARGELFTLGQNYAASGLRLELHPLINFFFATLYNLGDRSAFLQYRLEWSLAEDLLATVGINTPYGPTGSEYGGIALESQQLGAPLQGYGKISYFF